MPHLSNVEKARVATKIESGPTINDVAAEFNVSRNIIRSTVKRISRRWREGRHLNRTPSSGRPKISNVFQDQALINILTDNPFENAVNARMLADFPGSSRTARRRISSSHLSNRAAARKPFLTQTHKENRIFSDEKTFQSSYNG